MKILIIRFSSIGDVVQAMSVVDGLNRAYPDAEIHWLVRSDLSQVVSADPRIRVWSFDRAHGLLGLVRLAWTLRGEGFTHAYDAHGSLRSCVVSLILYTGPKIQWVRRSKERLKRFLLFYFRINRFDQPYRGRASYQKPLLKWGVAPSLENTQKWNLPEVRPEWKGRIVLVPSAAWEMKRWPVDHWKELVRRLPDEGFVILGGPKDGFCADIAAVAPDRVLNLAGQLSLLESTAVVAQASRVVSADTGLIHVADLLGVPGVLLLGPTAFGRTSGSSVQVLEKPLPCRPCTKDGRGRCSQAVWRRCMVEITPDEVAESVLASKPHKKE